MESVRLAPWASSLGIHALFLALFLVFQLRAPLRPWGVDRFGDPTFVEVIGRASVRSSSPVAKPRISNDSITRVRDPFALTAPKTVGSQPDLRSNSTGGFGAVEGTSLQGELGTADGVRIGARDRYLSDLRTTLEARKKYPPLSRRMAESGRVLIRFQIARDGQFSNVTVLKSSGYERLNSAALALVQELARYREFPSAIMESSLSVEIPIDYVLD